MVECQTWRELLRMLIEDPLTKQVIVTRSKLHPATLERWANGIHKPYANSLERLVQSIPSQWQETFTALIKQEVPVSPVSGQQPEEPALTLPAEFYFRVLRIFANEAISLRETSSAMQLIEQQILGQFDPLRRGLAVLLARCLPPLSSAEIVRSLRGEIRAGGRAPYRFLLGAETVSGSVVERNQALCIADTRSQSQPREAHFSAESVMATPLRQSGAVAGCLTLCSPHPCLLEPRLLPLLEQYADLLALALPSQEFYEASRITLATLPAAKSQEPLFATFQEQISRVRQASSVSLSQAEVSVWQQIEAELRARSS